MSFTFNNNSIKGDKEFIIVGILCIAALFPILPPALQSISFGLFCICSILFYYPNFKSRIKEKNRVIGFFVLSAYYFWLLFSYSWSLNSHNFWRETQVNILLLLVPFVAFFFQEKIQESSKNIILTFFLLGMMLYLYQWYQFTIDGIQEFQLWGRHDIWYQTYPEYRLMHDDVVYGKKFIKDLNFLDQIQLLKQIQFDFHLNIDKIIREGYHHKTMPAFFNHHTYTSMWSNFAILICIHQMKSLKNWLQIFGYLFLILIFSVFIIFNASKINILCLAIIPLVFIYFLFDKFRIILGILYLINVLILFGNSSVRERLNSIHLFQNEISREDNNKYIIDYTRTIIYKEGIKIFKANMLLGCGIGDINDKLNGNMDKKGFDLIYGDEVVFNTHSQFLYFLAATGLVGLLLFVISLLYLLNHSFNYNQYLLFCGLLIIIVNCLFENILSRSWGVYFISILLIFIPDFNNGQNKLKIDIDES